MTRQCEHCHRTYDPDTADDSCPHAAAAPASMHGPRASTTDIWLTRYAPAYGGTLHNQQLQVHDDVGSIVEVIIRAETVIPSTIVSPPQSFEIRREHYQLHASGTGEHFYRIVQDHEPSSKPATKPARTGSRPAETARAVHHVQGAANQQRAREQRRRDQ